MTRVPDILLVYRELRVVSDDRLDADEDGVAGIPQLVHSPLVLLVGDLRLFSGLERGLAVGGHRAVHDDSQAGPQMSMADLRKNLLESLRQYEDGERSRGGGPAA